MPDTEMPFTVEESDRLNIDGGVIRYIAVLTGKLTLWSLFTGSVLLLITTPIAASMWFLSPTAFGFVIVLAAVLGARLAVIAIKYNFKFPKIDPKGTRSGMVQRDPRLRIFILSAGGVNALILTAAIVGALVASVAPTSVAVLATFGVLVGNELVRQRFEISLSIIGVRATARVYQWLFVETAQERREFAQIKTGAEWLTSGLTMFSTLDPQPR